MKKILSIIAFLSIIMLVLVAQPVSAQTITDLGTLPGGTYSNAYGINDLGQIVGESTYYASGYRHAVLWTVSIPSPTPEIHGTKWDDLDGDGVRDGGEPGVANVTICYVGSSLTNCTLTDAGGNYSFMNLSPGSYTVHEIVPPDRHQTFPANGSPHFINLTAGEVRVGVDFGNQPIPAGEIRGMILNACTDAPISGATATLLVEFPPGSGTFIVSPTGNQMPDVNPQITGADGMYSWLTVPGTYRVRAEKVGFVTDESSPVSVPPPVTGLDISLTPTGGCLVPPPVEGRVKGEGWIESPFISAKKDRVTFDFEARNRRGGMKGKLEFHDQAAGLKVKGDVTTLSINKTAMMATFSGTAKIKTDNGTVIGSYTVMAWDNSKKGKANDVINITLSTGYMANGTLGGGNIRVDP